MLYRIHFESFDSKGFKCSYNSFSLKECKGMHKMMQLISKNLCKKNMLPFIQLHIHYVNLMKKKNHMKISNSLNFETKGVQGKLLLHQIIWLLFLYMSNSKKLALDACHMCKK